MMGGTISRQRHPVDGLCVVDRRMGGADSDESRNNVLHLHG